MVAPVLVRTQAVTILNGTSESTPPINLHGESIVGILFPAAWTAADLTFTGHAGEAGTFEAVFDDGNAEVKVVAATVAARVGDWVVPATILNKLTGLHFLKLRSGVKGTPVNQGADRTFTVLIAGR